MIAQIPEQFDIMVTVACNARCPFCVQEVTYRPSCVSEEKYIAGLEEHFAAFYALGGRRVVITGGEPTLEPTLQLVLDSLHVLSRYKELEVKALYTNGSRLLAKLPGQERTVAQQLKEAGLGCVNLTVHDFEHSDNQRIFSLDTIPMTEEITSHLKECRLPFRFNLTLHRGGIDDYEQFVRYVEWAFSQGARDIYVRDLFEYGFSEPLCESDRNALPFAAAHRIDVASLINAMKNDRSIFTFCGERTEGSREKREFKFLHRPSGIQVYMTLLRIGTEDRDQIPYLIYMPDGRLYRGWLGEGDVLQSLALEKEEQL